MIKRCNILTMMAIGLLVSTLSFSTVFGGKRKVKDWVVSFRNDTPDDVNITIHGVDGLLQIDTVDGFKCQKKIFKKSEVVGITIGSDEEGLGTYIQYGLMSKLRIDYERDSLIQHQLIFDL